MQDIFTSLVAQEVSQAMKAKAFIGMQAALIVALPTIGAVSFYGEYVGAVLVLFFPAHYPDLAKSNGCAYPCDPTDGAAVPAHKGRGVKPLAPQQGGGATRHSQLHQGVLAPFLLGHDRTRFRSRSTARDRSTIESGHYPLLIKIRVGKNGAGVS